MIPARYIQAVLLSLVVLLQSLALLVIETEWNLNREYIAAVLCENTDRPDLQCDGKCFLKKELSKQEENRNTSATHLLNFNTVTFFVEGSAESYFVNYCREVLLPVPFLPDSKGYLKTAERPPTG